MTAPVDDAGKNNICTGHSTRFRSSRRHAAIFGACWPEVPPHSRSISGGAGRRWAADDVVVANAISIGKYLHISIRPALSHMSTQAGVTVAIQQISAQPRRNETEAAKRAALHVGPGCGPETARRVASSQRDLFEGEKASSRSMVPTSLTGLAIAVPRRSAMCAFSRLLVRCY